VAQVKQNFNDGYGRNVSQHSESLQKLLLGLYLFKRYAFVPKGSILVP